MRKIILAVCCLLSFSGLNNSYGSFVVSSTPVVNNTSWKNIKATDFVKLTVKDFSSLSGKKLTLKEKIAFTIMKAKMKREIKKNPNLTVADYLSNSKKLGTGWIILISVLGTLLILIVAFLISWG